MNELLIMILSLIVVIHGIGRLSQFDSVLITPWRIKFLLLSIFAEISGSFIAIGESGTHTMHSTSIVLLLIAVATGPLFDRRKHRHQEGINT